MNTVTCVLWVGLSCSLAIIKLFFSAGAHCSNTISCLSLSHKFNNVFNFCAVFVWRNTRKNDPCVDNNFSIAIIHSNFAHLTLANHSSWPNDSTVARRLFTFWPNVGFVICFANLAHTLSLSLCVSRWSLRFLFEPAEPGHVCDCALFHRWLPLNSQ